MGRNILFSFQLLEKFKEWYQQLGISHQLTSLTEVVSEEFLFPFYKISFFTMSSALNTPSRFKLTGNRIGKGGKWSGLREIMHDSRSKIVDIWSFRPMCICRSLSLRKRNKHGKDCDCICGIQG